MEDIEERIRISELKHEAFDCLFGGKIVNILVPGDDGVYRWERGQIISISRPALTLKRRFLSLQGREHEYVRYSWYDVRAIREK